MQERKRKRRAISIVPRMTNNMSSRLGHKKSRNGCQRCKVRKVKCDEARPVCADCTRHMRPCIYPSDVRAYRGPDTPDTIASTIIQNIPSRTLSNALQPESVGSGPLSPYANEPLEDISPAQRRILEFLLLHHFTTVVAATFPSNNTPEILWRWTVQVAHYGFEHPFLLNAMMALSALHLALVPETRPGPKHDFDFAKVHRIYLNSTVQEQRLALSDINSSNAFALAMTTMMINLMSVRLLPEEGEPYGPPVQWLAMSSAMRTISIATSRLCMEQGEESITEFLKSTSGPDFRNPHELFDRAYTQPFRMVLDFRDGVEIFDEEDHAVYDSALAYVYKIYRGTSELEREPPNRICRRLMGFGPSVPRRFNVLAAERRPRALVILAHHFSMVKSVEHFWWLKGTAEREVYGIQSVLPEKWMWAMDWPLATLKQYS